MSSSDQSDASAEAAVIFDQGHARLHYAVAVALQNAGILEAAFCDFYNTEAGFSRLAVEALRRVHTPTGQRMAERRNDRLDATRIETDAVRTLLMDLLRVTLKVPAHRHWSRWSRVRSAKIRRGLHRGNTLHGFVTSLHPPLVREARERGLLTCGEQIIAPVAEQRRQAALQRERFPGADTADWEVGSNWLGEMEASTWPLLDRVTCPSSYVKEALVAAGVGADRVHVHPYPYQLPPEGEARPAARADRPLTVGFLGSVNLRKGAPYFLQVAQRLASDRLHFKMVGPVDLDEAWIQAHGDRVTFVGPVSRSRVREEMRSFDVFYFPSTCEGSAGVVYEAAEAGLPIVTSRNSGTHLRDGMEAQLCNYDDVEGACEQIEMLAGDAALRDDLGAAARSALERCTVARYGQFLRRVFEEGLQEVSL